MNLWLGKGGVVGGGDLLSVFWKMSKFSASGGTSSYLPQKRKLSTGESPYSLTPCGSPFIPGLID